MTETKLSTAQEIHAILGPVDSETVFNIQQTGANLQEVLEAFTLLNGDEGLKRPASARAQAVYEILLEMEDEAETRR